MSVMPLGNSVACERTKVKLSIKRKVELLMNYLAQDRDQWQAPLKRAMNL
jgi:hypothetical protein